MYDSITQIPVPGRVSVLPTGRSLNARHPDPAKHTYFDPKTVVYVLYKLNERRTRPTRVLTSSGPIDGWRIGSVLALEHDQTNAYLDDYMIVGVKDFETGEQTGDVPDLSIKHAVLK